MKYSFTFFFVFLFIILAFAQVDERENQHKYQLKIVRATDEIKLDGIVEEATWKVADVATDFWQKTPRDDIKAVLRTEMRLSYDDDFLYVAAVCYDSTNHIIPTLKRDEFWGGDGFGVVLDPLNAASSGFMFCTNPYGVQTEVLLGGGTGSEHYNDEWNNRWAVEAKIYEDRWTAEMAIPFKSLRYEAGRNAWGINFFRNDKKNNRQDVWAQVPLQFWFIDMGYTGRLEWDDAPKRTNGNMTFIPYANASSFQDFEANETADNSFNIGGDAKIALSPSLNLDLTVNPDFSQVEVDQQVTNLTRFSIFLPEQRNFFIENSDVFTQMGFRGVQPFFSRRIGLDSDGNAVPIAFGARLTGNATGTTRVGLLNVQTRATDNQFAQNYTAASINQRVLKRSRLQAMFINRQAFEQGEMSNTDYGRNASLKFNYLSSDGTVEFWSGAHASLKEGIDKDNYFFENGAAYSSKRFTTSLRHAFVGTNYFADVGFINRLNNYDAVRDTTIRLGYHSFSLPLTFRIIPEASDYINQHSINAETTFFLDPKARFVENTNSLRYQMRFKNSSQFGVRFENTATDLRFPFSFTGDEPLPIGRYGYNQLRLNYDSDGRKLFRYDIRIGTGTFYNGNLTSARLGLTYRTQPWGNFGMRIEYNKLDFPTPYGSTTLWAFSPRIEISFNRNLFWTTFLQYNTQADNFNLNSRFQWRFAPMSDLYVVYTDNYAIENFGKKNRALVLKVNYWLVL